MVLRVLLASLLLATVALSMEVRVTFYYPGEDGSGHKASTGVRLQPWKHCAVDNKTIRYGKTIVIPNLGKFLATDTGTAVVSRKAAKLSGRNVPVVDVCVPDRRTMERLARTFPKFVKVEIK